MPDLELDKATLKLLLELCWQRLVVDEFAEIRKSFKRKWFRKISVYSRTSGNQHRELGEFLMNRLAMVSKSLCGRRFRNSYSAERDSLAKCHKSFHPLIRGANTAGQLKRSQLTDGSPAFVYNSFEFVVVKCSAALLNPNGTGSSLD